MVDSTIYAEGTFKS